MQTVGIKQTGVQYKNQWGRDIPEDEINVLPFDPDGIFITLFDCLEKFNEDGELCPYIHVIAVLARDAARELKHVVNVIERDIGKIELVYESRPNDLHDSNDPLAARLTAID